MKSHVKSCEAISWECARGLCESSIGGPSQTTRVGSLCGCGSLRQSEFQLLLFIFNSFPLPLFAISSHFDNIIIKYIYMSVWTKCVASFLSLIQWHYEIIKWFNRQTLKLTIEITNFRRISLIASYIQKHTLPLDFAPLDWSRVFYALIVDVSWTFQITLL